ncbi:FHA domain-containing protein [Propionivibrio limicola]|uniref:FHA domain-containing protein n=1 Tax=Propionivibrio limicola TaxID=167645 RepID=UPI001290C56D|nr:FHA domain-containing protein [Propionivibrio limicola]
MNRARTTMLLYAEVRRDGGTSDTAFDDEKAGHPIDRRLNRIERVVAANNGQISERSGHSRLAVFSSADSALLAAREMQKRCSVLPHVSGQTLALRIGLHCEIAHQRSNDGDEDARGTTARLAAIDDGIVVSDRLAEMLSDDLREMTRPLITPRFAVPALQADWRAELPNGRYGGESFFPSSVMPLAGGPSIRLTLGLKSLQLSLHHPVATIGRDPANDLVVVDDHVSRNHCLIEVHPGRIVLSDTSTNGTTIVTDAGVETIIKRRTAVLEGHGFILPGRLFRNERRGGIRFETV